MLTALQLADTLIKAGGHKLSELKNKMAKFPQVLVNVRVTDKSKLKDNGAIEQSIRKVEELLGEDGRVLVRPSGTESLIRVMAEGPVKADIEAYVNDIVQVVEQELC